MRPSFNTAGPCVPGEHYLLPPEVRLGRVMQLIDEGKFFTLRASHQTGKTTCTRWLVQHYNQSQRSCCLWVDVQTARELPYPLSAFRVLLEKVAAVAARALPYAELPDIPTLLETPQTAVLHYLQALAHASPLPLVILFDEADVLVGPALVSFLTQLRDGYIDRQSAPFPHSVVLIGRREVRDQPLSPSPFNISAEAHTLSLFSATDTAALLQQHTHHTGQRLLPDAAARLFDLSQGQPWLVNALADQIVDHLVTDRQVPITAAHVDAAAEALHHDRRAHLEALVGRLHEPRVRRVIEPMLLGELIEGADTLHDDLTYVIDLGLLSQQHGRYQVANPFYKELIPRALGLHMQGQLPHDPAWFIRPSGELDMPRLMTAWQEFWRGDGHLAAAGLSYQQAGSYLMLMAFLQRIVNGAGRIDRDYGLGRGSLSLLIHVNGERHAVEVTLRRDSRSEGKALEQLSRGLDRAGLTSGWLVLFDERKSRSWKQRLFQETHKREGRTLRVVGC